MALGLHSPVSMVASGAAVLFGLAVVVGLAAAGAAARGPRWHWVAMTIVWIAIQEYAAPEGRDGRVFVLIAPIGALVLVAIGGWLRRGARWAPALLGVALVAGGILAPEVRARS